MKRRTTPIPHNRDDWFIARRKGRMVRWQNRVTAAFGWWEEDPFTEARLVPKSYSREMLEGTLRDGLVLLAQDLGVKGVTRMRKADLVNALLNA